ncbi:MAG TPA: hypothetical protein VI074_14290 [Propionibacteriaceae bacterium]
MKPSTSSEEQSTSCAATSGFGAEQGAFVYLPRGLSHSFIGVSDDVARVLVFMLPAGLEQAFADPQRFGEIFEHRHVKVIGPPLSP